MLRTGSADKLTLRQGVKGLAHALFLVQKYVRAECPGRVVNPRALDSGRFRLGGPETTTPPGPTQYSG